MDDETPILGAAEALDVVGDEVRLGVLRALVERDGPQSFSALRAAVGVADSGRFNYHLQQLVGRFVEKREDGYALRYPGAKVAHAVLAGTFTERERMAPTPVEGECRDCGAAALVAAYEDERLHVRCGDCGRAVASVPFPPSAVAGRDPGAVVVAFDRWSTAQARLAADGVCPECAGPMDGRVRTDVPDALDHALVAEFECRVCRRRATTSFGGVALHHRAVLAFHHRRDVFPLERPYWTVPQLVSDEFTEVVGTDPWRVEVAFEADGDVATATVDETATVVEVETPEEGGS
jgi:hypothetical protein